MRTILAFSIDQAEILSIKNPDAVVVFYDVPVLWRAGHHRRLTPTQFRFVFSILARRGGVAVKEDIFEDLYGDREDGGPEAQTKMMDVLLCKCRQFVAPLGIVFRTEHGRGICAELIPILTPETTASRSVE